MIEIRSRQRVIGGIEVHKSVTIGIFKVFLIIIIINNLNLMKPNNNVNK